ncbi:phosphatidate phosphatase PAH1 [Lolium rigidum]|uniref:phosphatidate phosphatase PAH1 n=1 Tax=Lolium rigidum TaxID=89674 RepID=UPI001F5CCF30|nr:phosphatidate phosphatase PAH1 [Lolium rigidum]
MDVVGMVGRGVGRVLSQGMYSVATPFHPFGGAVDIIVVEQRDGSYRSTPWYVRFGKFQGVLKGAEKVVTITVNGVDASFHMLLDNSGQAYFMRELVPGSEEDSGAGSGVVVSEPETPLRSKSDGELYMGSGGDQLGSSELNEEEQTGDEFDSYLEETEALTDQADGGASEMLLVSVNGCVLTAPISSTEESMEDVQLSDPQFHLGPGQSSSGDFSRNGEVWESGILDDLYISQDKVKFDSAEHPSEAPEKLQEPSVVKADESLDISVTESETLHVSVDDGEACVASTREAEVQVVSRSVNNGLNNQLLNLEDEAHDVSGNNIEGYQPLPNNDEALDVLESSDEAYIPLANGDEACDVPLVQNDEACKSPSKVGKVCDGSNENIEDNVKASFSRYDTFRSCLDLTSQDDGDSGTEPFSPEFDHQRDSQLSSSNHSDIDIDLGEDRSETAQCDQSDPSNHLEDVDVSEITSDDNITQGEDLLSCEGDSDGSSKAPSKAATCKTDRLRLSPRISDKDKLGSIPEHPISEEELNKEEHPQLQKGLGFEISLCGHMLRPGMGRTSADEVFQQHLVPEEDLKLSGPSIIKNANLIVKVDGNYFVWSKVSHVVLGKAVFGPDFSVEHVDAIPVERQETPRSGEDSLGMSPSSRRWRLWPIPFRISRSLQRSNSDSSEDIFLDTETVLSPMDEQAPENNKNQSPRKQFVRTLIPTSEQVASLNLKEGQNIITFSFSTRVFGKQQVEAHIYVWKWNAKIVISDVDGTITRSDVLGQVMPLVGRDWSQSGVARLFSAIKENGYQLIFLSARAIVQAYLTKSFLFNLKQDGKVLPNGPVVISPDGLFPSLYREVIRRAPHEFKIACLEDIKALFPSDYNPFYAGFGNRDTDELSYKKMGIPKGKIFIINPKGEVAINSSVDVKSYTSLHTLVNDMFPPTTLVEQEDYNSWNYWKVPLPDVDL